MKRWGAFAVAVAMIAVGTAHPAAADDSGTCDSSACHHYKPECWVPSSVPLRPGLTRAVVISCNNATGARLVSPPAHVSVSDVSTDWRGLHFNARPDDDAPRSDEATFEVSGTWGSIEVRVPLEVIPRSENSAPTCWVPDVAKRTDGTGPATVTPYPYCSDAEGDEFLVDGGGPGVHLDTPKPGPAYDGYDWHYRTATSAGTETTRIWATDFLGARSQDADFDVTVGPDVDQPPQCWGSTYGNPQPVYARPGVVRRFGVFCADYDGDPFVPRMSTPPARGALVPVVMPAYSYSDSYFSQSVDATYTPVDDSLEPDPFAFTASGVRGDGPPHQMAIVPRPLPDNGGGTCDWGSATLTTDVPGEVSARCTDDEGDPLTAEIVLRPRHGTAGPPVVTPATYGAQAITIPFTSEAGFEGLDCVKVKVTDGHGWVTEFTIDIYVWGTPPPGEGWYVPPPPPLPPWPGPPVGPPTGYPPPRFRHQNARAVAQQSLGTTAVKRVRRDDGSEVWARSKLSKGDLLRYGRSPAVVVICLRDCQIRSDAGLAGLPRARASRRKAVAQRGAGEAQVVTLDLSRNQQRALRRARRPRATFNLSVRAAGGTAQAVRRSIAIGR